MKKNIIFLMTLITILIVHSNVKAASTNFYEAEKIDSIYTKSIKNGTTHFQKSRFFRRKSDNKAAYCIEPFNFFDESASYKTSINPNNIDQNTWERMSLIAYYGYNYQGHTDNKWYAITQLMLWQTVDKDADFYFTDYLNGNKIEKFTNEIAEINDLVNNHYIKPSFANKTININIKNNKIIDTNNVLQNFYPTTSNISIVDNYINLDKLTEGNYSFTFKRKYQNNEPVLFYYNQTSQNLMTGGYLPNDEFSLNINIYKTKLKITKIDSDTKTTTSFGDGKLNETILELYDEKKNFLQEIKLNKDCTATIDNLDLGIYYLKEKQAGTGYIQDDSFHKIELTLDNTKINYEFENKIIEKEIFIHKEYGEENNTLPEENITFEIYKDNKLVYTITTDNLGNAKIKLPYGKYLIKQKNSKTGYKYVEDFEVIVNNETTDLFYNLYDYKIPIPNTRDDINKTWYIIVASCLLIMGIYESKKYNSK